MTLVKAEALNDFVVKTAPPTVFYVPNFITEEMERAILSEIYSSPKPKWETLLNRRLINYGGIVGKNWLMAVDDFPNLLRQLMSSVNNHLYRPTNHILVNEYTPGQGIMAHTDGPAFLPVINTVTLGSHTILKLYRPVNPELSESEEDRIVGSILLERRSLVVITDSLYKTYLHGIEQKVEDEINEEIWNVQGNKGDILKRETRVSITIRTVDKVRSLPSALLNRGK